uniref:Uncharacterized protein n=1 Tax=Globodera rostochiensis TaxID=31243 RepID=A0A914HRE5_GLORO
MEEFWILILVSLFATNSLDKAESVQLEETPLKIIDEIFGEGWWDNDKDEEWNKLTLEHTLHHQIDRQNTQIGKIEPNLTDQNPPPLTESDHSGQIEPNSTDQNPPHLTETDHFGQIEPNSTDQNPPLTTSDHSDNYNGEEQNEINVEDERKPPTPTTLRIPNPTSDQQPPTNAGESQLATQNVIFGPAEPCFLAKHISTLAILSEFKDSYANQID